MIKMLQLFLEYLIYIVLIKGNLNVGHSVGSMTKYEQTLCQIEIMLSAHLCVLSTV